MHLTLEQRETVRDILRAHAPGAEALAFGSRVRGGATPYSDLDIALKAKSALPLAALSALAEAFAESDLPFKVDIVDWHRASPEFQERIMEKWEGI